jgi:hypothetical protein
MLRVNTFSHQNLKINSHLFKLLPKCTEEIILSVKKFSSWRLFAPHIPSIVVQVSVNVVGGGVTFWLHCHPSPHVQFRQWNWHFCVSLKYKTQYLVCKWTAETNEKGNNSTTQEGRTGIYGVLIARTGSPSTSCACKNILFCVKECNKSTKESKTWNAVWWRKWII